MRAKLIEAFTHLKPKTEEEFFQVLKQMCSSENKGHASLRLLEQLPKGISFSNGGNVDLRSLKQLPEGTTFSNGGYVYLDSLEQLSKGISFYNRGLVDLRSLKQLPKGTLFSNDGNVYLNSLEQLSADFVYTGTDYVYIKNNQIKGPIGVKRTDEAFTHLKPKSNAEMNHMFQEVRNEIYWAITQKNISTCAQIIEGNSRNIELCLHVCDMLNSKPEDVIVILENLDNIKYHRIVINFFDSLYKDIDLTKSTTFFNTKTEIYNKLVINKKDKIVYWEYLFMSGWFVDLPAFEKRFKLEEGFTHMKPKSEKEISDALEKFILEVASCVFSRYSELFPTYKEALKFTNKYKNRILKYAIAELDVDSTAITLVMKYHPEFKNRNWADFLPDE